MKLFCALVGLFIGIFWVFHYSPEISECILVGMYAGCAVAYAYEDAGKSKKERD